MLYDSVQIFNHSWRGREECRRISRNQRERRRIDCSKKFLFFSQPKKRDIPPSVRNERPIIRGEREREKKLQRYEGSIVLVTFV